ncbi:MAG: HlyD family efflux transporter periplasmic adaptor subunit [Acutalibacteraceae bacterium]
MDKSLFKKITIGVITLLALIYVIYQFANANIRSVKTEYATSFQISDTLNVDGLILRDEEYVVNPTSGIVAYELDSGDKVSKNGTIAKIYNNESDAVVQKKIDKIQSDIAKLEELNKASVTVKAGLDSIDEQLNSRLVSFLYELNQQNFDSLDSTSDNFIYMVNERQIITEQVSDFNARISELSAQKQQLESQSGSAIGEIKAQKAGYFISDIDGYENSYKYSDIKKITLDDLTSIKAGGNVPSNAIGKISKGLNWYIVCPVTANQALNLSLCPENVSIELPFASTGKLPAKIVAINQTTKQSDGVVVFECNFMSYALSTIRQENVNVDMGTYSGIRVSKKAIHDDVVKYEEEDENGKTVEKEKKVQGVYVLFGNQIVFKQISVIYSGSDYVICDPSPKDGILLTDTVRQYDQVVVEGSDLYDGKIVK